MWVGLSDSPESDSDWVFFLLIFNPFPTLVPYNGTRICDASGIAL